MKRRDPPLYEEYMSGKDEQIGNSQTEIGPNQKIDSQTIGVIFVEI